MFGDGMDVVTVGLQDADGVGEDDLPPCIYFVASTHYAPYEGVDYGEIEALK